MKIKKNNQPRPSPQLQTLIDQGLYRETSRHEFHPGSWQQESHDNGRRFYQSTTRPEPTRRQPTVDDAAAEAAERGSTIIVKSPWGGEVMPYDEFVIVRAARSDAVAEPIGGHATDQTVKIMPVQTAVA